MKRLIRCICITLVAIMLLTTTAFATETASQRASYYFTRYSAYLYQTSDTSFQVWFDVTAVGPMSKLGVSAIEVQCSSDDTNWSTVKTYSPESYSQMIKSDAVSNINYVSYTGTTGCYYRAIVTFYAKDSTGSGERTYYTTSLYLPKP